MSKSIKFRNNVYLDAKSIAIRKRCLDDKFYHNNNWLKEYTIPYTDFFPKLVFIIWEQSFIVYAIYNGRVLTLAQNIPYGSAKYEIDSSNKNVKFVLSNTGVVTVLEI